MQLLGVSGECLGQLAPLLTLVVVAVYFENTDAHIFWRPANVYALLLVNLQHLVSIHRHRGVVQVAVTVIHQQDSDRPVSVMGNVSKLTCILYRGKDVMGMCQCHSRQKKMMHGNKADEWRCEERNIT